MPWHKNVFRFIAKLIFVAVCAIILNIILILSPVFINPVFAQESQAIFSDLSYTITDSLLVKDFSDITIFSDPEVEIVKEVMPGSSILFIPIADQDEITVSLENLPNKNLYFYIDSPEDQLQHSMKNGASTVSFTLSGREPHLIFIKLQPSTKTIRNDITGGDCATFGSWDWTTLTCTMNQDVFEVIQIVDNGITLDGNDKMVKWNNGFGIGSGVNISFRKNIIVKNLIVEGFDNGFGIFQTTNSQFLNNETRGFGLGFYLSFNDFDNIIDNNLVTNVAGYLPGIDITSSGIYLGQNVQRTTVRNNTISATHIGVVLISTANNNKIYNNNFMSTPDIFSSRNFANTLYQPMPIGGNYYRNYDISSEGCDDTNGDFICDGSISFGNVTDGLPWIYKNGWKGDRIPDGCATDCFSNVLFLPGLEASRLYKKTGGSEDQLWEPNKNDDVEALYLNSDGESIDSSIYTKEIIKETNVPIPTGAGGQNIYKSFSDMLDKLVQDQKIKEWKSFAYDWRQGVEDVVNNPQKYNDDQEVALVGMLQSLVASSKNGKVTIVAHSNGGLVAKAMLKKLQDDAVLGQDNLIDHVDVLILVAVPQIGTASAVPAVLHGYNQKILSGLLMDEVHARELGRNMEGAYGLLPSREYINRVNASPVTFDDTAIPSGVTTSMVKTFGNALDSYIEYKDFLFGTEGRINPAPSQTNLPIVLSPNLFSDAENLHDEIDPWIPPEHLRVIEIAGWGLDTIASFEYYPKLVSDPSSLTGFKFILDERPRFTLDGDKTVIVPSAQYMSAGGNAERYWLNIKRYNDDNVDLFGATHKNILEIKPLLNFMSNIIQEMIPPDSIYLNTTIPVDMSNHLRLSVHSPVTLDAYDFDGKHTGKVCSDGSDFCFIEENISNSLYVEFGEGKYLNLPEDKAKSIKLYGTGIGTFTYESERVLPNGASSVSSFIDIPVTTQTQAEVVMDQGGMPELKLDVTGDGVPDFTLAPSATFDPVLYLQIMKTTINSLDLLQAKKDALNKRIDNVIKLIQSDKISKAVLKADKFGLTLEKTLNKPDPKKPRPKKLSKTEAQLILDMLNKLLDNLK